METLKHEEINKLFIGILTEFDTFCNTHHLQYWLMWGSLLGAVRHKGFIPWDDDVDVCMPREDYETFIKIYNQESVGRYRLIHFTQQKEVNRRLAFLTDTHIGLMKHGIKSALEYDCLGIDIFPIDKVNNNKLIKTVHELRMSIWQTLYTIKSIDAQVERFFLKNWFIKTTKVLLTFVPRKYIVEKCDYLAKKYRSKKTSNLGIYAIKTYGRFMVFNANDFTQTLRATFENKSFNIAAGYNNILTTIYGDYMNPPAPEKRRPHNPFDEYYIKEFQ